MTTTDDESTTPPAEGSTKLTARFTVDHALPTQPTGFDGDWVGMLIFTKTFTAGIVGSAQTLFMSAGAEGSRSYVATEQIAGTVGNGMPGSITIQHGGLESDPTTWFGHIVPGTGTGGFAGWSGSARIRHDQTGAFFEFDQAI